MQAIYMLFHHEASFETDTYRFVRPKVVSLASLRGSVTNQNLIILQEHVNLQIISVIEEGFKLLLV
jgi:hypothetical protein